jgi:hypothetical protein
MSKIKKAQAQQDQVRKKVAKKQSDQAKSYQQILQEQKAVLKENKTAEQAIASN